MGRSPGGRWPQLAGARGHHGAHDSRHVHVPTPPRHRAPPPRSPWSRSSSCPRPRLAADEFPRRLRGLSHLRRGRRLRQGGRRRASRHRQAVQHRQELPGPRDLGDEDLGQRRDGRDRARGPVRGRPPRRRAHGRRDGAQDHALARRRLRHATRGSRTSSTAARSGSSSWSTRTAPSTTSPAASSTTGARTASRRPAPRTSARTSTGTTAIAGAAAAARARTRRPSRTAAPRRSRRPRRAPCATSWPAASSAAGSRSGSRISFHESGRLVMWPYGYTMTDVPSDMTSADHDALVHIGKQMAASNGYRPQQASDLYITSGTTRDFMYGMYRTFSYTFEMSVTRLPGRLADRQPRPAATRRRSCTSPNARGARLRVLGDDRPAGALRRLRRRPRGRPRLGVEPRRHRHRDQRQVHPGQPGRRRRPAARSSWTDVPSGSTRARHRRGAPGRRPTRTTSTAGRRCGARRSSCRPATRSAAVLPLRVRPRLELVVGRRAGREHRDVRAAGPRSSR